jgi:peroxiredoxin
MNRPVSSPAIASASRAVRLALACTAAIVTVALVAPPAARSGPGPTALVGKPAPDFELPKLAGDGRVKLSALAGQVVVIDFWASWCEPCKRELPVLQKLHDALAPSGLVVLAISVDEDPAEARRFVLSRKLTLPTLSDVRGTVPDRFKLDRMPTAVLIDRKGVVRDVRRGYEPGDEKALEDQLRKLLAVP